TAVRVLNELAASGLVVRERGRGTRVRFTARGELVRGPAQPADERSTAPRVSVESYLERLRGRISIASDVTIHGFDYVVANEAVARALGIPVGAERRVVPRVWRSEDKPYNHLVTAVPAHIGRRWTRDDMQRKPLTLLIEESGIRIERIDERVSATLADM